MTTQVVGGVAIAPETRDRWAPIFYLIVTVGIVLGFALGVREIVDKPPVRLGGVRTGETADGTPRAQVLARNYSAVRTYCIEVTISAVDGDGLTLAEAVAVPTTGEGRLQPGQSVNLVAVLGDLTPAEINEKLDEYLAFVTERHPC